MSAPDSSHLHFQNIRNSPIRIYVGDAVTISVKLVDELRGLLNSSSRFREAGVYFDRNGDNLVERRYLSGGYEGEQRVPPTNENYQKPPHADLSGGDPDIEMRSPPDENQGIYPQLPTPDLTNHQLEASVATLKSRVDGLEAENSFLKRELQQTIGEKTDLTSKLYTATQETSRVNELDAGSGVLRTELQQTIEQKTELSSKLYKVTQERDDLIRQRQTSLLKIRKLNDMIIKNSQTSDEPLDDEILQDMFKVRNMTTEIIKRFFPREALFRTNMAEDLTNRLKNPFYSQFYRQILFPDKTLETRHRRLISLLFRELHIQFFGPDARRFGLPRDMETKFQEFERMIERSNKVDVEESLVWRTHTVSYAVREGLSYRETIEECAKVLGVILGPMVLQEDDKRGIRGKKEGEDFFHALYNLCSAALKLALRFRSSKTKYEFKTYEDNTSLAACDAELIKKLASEGPISKPMDPNKLQIFCTLFGALVKTRPSLSGEPSNPVVLEAGHVIVHEPELRSSHQ